MEAGACEDHPSQLMEGHCSHTANGREWRSAGHTCARGLARVTSHRDAEVLTLIARRLSVHHLFITSVNYFALGTSAKYCAEYVCSFVCLSVCLYNRVTRTPLGWISPNSLRMLSVVVARSSSDGVAICSVLPDLYMTSYFHTMRPVGQNETRHYISTKFPMIPVRRQTTTVYCIW